MIESTFRRWLLALLVTALVAWPVLAEEDAPPEKPAAPAAAASAQADASATAKPAEGVTPAAPAAPDTGPLPGHSSHGEAFNQGPRQKAYLMPGTGRINFPVTTKNPEVQRFINQGIGQLHGFWYYEAERSFRQAAMIDPDCAIAYLGMAMANDSNVKRGKPFIQKAMELKDKASKREQMYIEAQNAYLNADPKKDKERKQAFIDALEAITHDFPDDIEAKAFLGLHLWEWRGSIPISSYQAVDAILQQVLAANPMHPVHHYRIHLWDGKRAATALNSAARCGQSAPGIAHMWHMAGHIFDKVQRYDDAAWQQEASARTDHAFMMRDRVMPDQIHNYAHNNEWLCRSLMSIGRVGDAADLAMNMIELPRHPKYNNGGGSNTYGKRRLFDVLERFEMWDEILACTGNVYLSAEDDNDRIRNLRIGGVALLAKGDRPGAEAMVAELDTFLTEKKAAQDKAGDDAAAKATEEKKDEKAVTKAREDARKKLNDPVQKAETALNEIRGWLAMADGKKDEAIKLIEAAKDTPKWRLAYAYFEAGDAKKAEDTAKGEVSKRKNQTHPLAVLADIQFRAGRKDAAVETFKQLHELAAQVDLKAAPFARLAPIAKEVGLLKEDWRPALTLRNDSGIRPSLDTLGPFRWSPSPAPSWKLPDGDGKIVGLDRYHGKPVIVIFYLGYGCVHCTEQLNAFAPMVEEFTKAGIEIVGVSTDNVVDLHKALKPVEKDGGFAFQLVSNADLSIFKDYRAYDDFEKQPLHGTFLIDANGLVRWQDVGFEPFMDGKFLLKEAGRLLKLPVKGGSGSVAKTSE
ncbi:MAG: redoxin domain-containing protein [Phycisphaeraceae bacterium]